VDVGEGDEEIVGDALGEPVVDAEGVSEDVG